MYAVTTQCLLERHRQLQRLLADVRDVARCAAGMTPGDRAAAIEDSVRVLRSTVLPYVHEVERSAYPAVVQMLGDPRATETMTSDRVAMETRIDDLASIDPTDVDRVQELLYGLYALLSVHLWKEEHLYLPLLRELEAPSLAEAVDYESFPVLSHEP
jgi:hypothetical protein